MKQHLAWTRKKRSQQGKAPVFVILFSRLFGNHANPIEVSHNYKHKTLTEINFHKIPIMIKGIIKHIK